MQLNPLISCLARRLALRGALLAVLVFTVSLAYAVDPQKNIAQYAHEIWNAKRGLPEADVMAVLQTRDGYLWVGTEEGLARFDGKRFKVFDRKAAHLRNNRVQALAETSDGSLWIGTENGLSRYKDHEFTNYDTHDGLPSNNIRALWSASDGSLWITTMRGVLRWNGQAFQQERTIVSLSATCSPRQVLPTAGGEIWIACDSELISVPNNGSGSPRHISLQGKFVRTLLQDSAGSIWVGASNGLYRLTQTGLQNYPLHSVAANPEVTALLEDRDHNLWAGTLGDGLIRINKQGVQHYSIADGLSAVEVKSLFEDKTGNLWIGTFGGGLEVFRDTMFTPYGRLEGLSENLVWTVMEGRDSSLWIGTQSGGLNRLKNEKVTVYSTRQGFTDNTVGSLLESRDGTLWLGKDSGLSRLGNGKMLGAPFSDPLFHEQVHVIHEDTDGTIWFGTRNSGLVQIRGNKYTQFTTQDGLPHNNIQTIVSSKLGGLWIGTLGGLSHYQNGKFTNLTAKDGLSSDQVVSLYEDAAGVLWIGSDGLSRLKDGRITNYSDQGGLFDQYPMAILEDDNGYLWLSTNKGIFRVSKRELNEFASDRTKSIDPIQFGTEDGMRSAECNGGSSPAAWKDHSGNLWFATVAGALKVDPRRVNANSQALQLHIEDIVADDKSINPSDSLRLSPGGHHLEFHYIAPYFAGAGRVHYKYRLEGFDKDWVDAGGRTVAYYTNIPPGDYRFRVSATASDAAHGQDEAFVSFYLTPHFYQTPLFYLAIVVAGTGFVLLGWLWSNRFMISRQNELRRLVKARTRELEAEKAELLEAKAKLAQQASHDDLTGLMNRVAIFRVLEQQIRQAEREKNSFIILLADLDHFKQINDTHGHLVGDDVLREFAQRLKTHLRAYDSAGRFGGEEFLIVMPGLSGDSAERITSLQRQLCQEPFPTDKGDLAVTCSIGVAAYHPEIRDVESLVHIADQALYAAKANGRNRVEFAETALHSSVPLHSI
jgi:diguanylate cyclase (GGDEF)-like protein